MAEPLSFCMVTTFYPPYHFGGDAIHAYRLTNALARRGHEVTVVYSEDAYRALGGDERRRSRPSPASRSIRCERTASGVGVARHLPDGPAGVLRARARRGPVRPRLRRRPLPQRLARRRARRCSATATGVKLYTTQRALARLPDARALPGQPRAVRRAALPALHARASTGRRSSGARRACSSGRCRTSTSSSRRAASRSRRTARAGSRGRCVTCRTSCRRRACTGERSRTTRSARTSCSSAGSSGSRASTC